jgi:putative membrane-bound dehydrogenase-like protein
MRSLMIAIVCWGLFGCACRADAPVPPQEAPGKMTLPAGFHATLFAGEPAVVQPIACTVDDRGRMWVVECLSYPKWTEDGTGRDRVTIFEDTDGDGKHDKRTVFFDRGVNLSGIEYGFGGVWLTSLPNLIFIPDRNGDDRPDGPAEVLLDGWDLKAKHNVVNSLGWGPDGWLYGCNGILSNSQVGRPGAPDTERVSMNCGVWRYHPTRKNLEAVAWGTTNPWGLDWDDYGQAFITNCVIKHLFHVMPGAHYERMFGQDLNQHVYELLPSCADHRHWAGGPWESSRSGDAHSDFGGGHAHSGCMVYLGDNFPAEYRNNVFTCNIHGNRVNRDTLEIEGASYVAHHAPDFLHAHDPWFRGLVVKSGPEGGLYVTDWTDTGECHNYEVADTSNGRIYRVVYGQPKHQPFDLAKKTDDELVALQRHSNDWMVRHARRLLQERAAAGKLAANVPQRLDQQLVSEEVTTPQRLRAVWALHAIGQTTSERVAGWLKRNDNHVRGWAVTLAGESLPATTSQTEAFARLALNSESPFVRRELAGLAQRYAKTGRLSDATTILVSLAARPEDAADPVLSALLWYAIEPIVDADPDRALQLLKQARQPFVRQSIVRKCALTNTAENRRLDRVLQLAQSDARRDWRHDVIRGLLTAYAGLSHVDPPTSWGRAYATLATPSVPLTARPEPPQKQVDPAAPLAPEYQSDLDALAVLFGDEHKLNQLRKQLLDPDLPVAERLRTLELLHSQRPADLPPQLIAALDVDELRSPAIRMLAAYGHEPTPAALLQRYAKFTPAERQEAIATLASRPGFARTLLDAVAGGTIPRSDVSALVIRQLQALKQPQLDARLKSVWGEIRPASQAKQQLAEKYRQQLSPTVLAGADLSKGKALYGQSCGQCHKLFGQGGGIGPELTGSQRSHLDYLLDNVLDPSAIVPFDYRVNLLELDDGRVLQGIVLQETPVSLTLQTTTEKLTVAKTAIENQTRSPVSMMPEGLFDRLSDQDLRDLVGYLQAKQAP